MTDLSGDIKAGHYAATSTVHAGRRNLFFRKIFNGIATGSEISALRIRHDALRSEELLDGHCYAGEWFEIQSISYDEALDSLPPLFMRSGMFAMSELKTGNIASIFFSIRIRTRERWFHGFCDLSFAGSPEAMRAAIIARETNAADSMTRDEKLELIWNRTPQDYRGHAGSLNLQAWPPRDRGKRTILMNGGGVGTILTLLEDLTDEEIDVLLREPQPSIPPSSGGENDKSA